MSFKKKKMKVLIYILIVVAVFIIGLNITKLDSANLLRGDSSIAVISILAGMCTILLMTILLISRKIAGKIKK